METKYLLSIIIPLYNGEDFIQNTIDNILGKIDSTTNVEIVLIDDCSTDKTYDLCLKYSERFGFVSLYKNPTNMGVSNTRNRGIEYSRGKYLFFHDQDDAMNTTVLSEVLNVISNNEADLFLFESTRIKIGGDIEKLVLNNPKYCNKVLCGERYTTNLLNTLFRKRKSRNDITTRFGSIWSTIVKKEYVINNNLSFRRIIGYEDDFNFLFSALLSNPIIYASKLNIYSWKNRKESTTYSFSFPDNYVELLDQHKEFIGYNLCKNNRSISQTVLNNFYWQLTHEYLIEFAHNKNKKQANEFVFFVKENNIRNRIIVKTNCKKSFAASFVDTLVFLGLYRTLFYLIKLKTK